MFTLKPKCKFMLCVGEEGTILLYFKNNTLNKRYFVRNKNSNAAADMKSCLIANKDVPLYLVLNNSEQDYLLRYIPSVNRMSAYLAVKTEIERFANTYDINSAFLIEKPNKDNQNWCYLYVLSKVRDLIEYWLDILVNMGSNFKGILMFPIEVRTIVRSILHTEWSIMVMSTKTGGYRQLVMQNNKIVFTNLIHSNNDYLPGIIAGKVYQEVKNTIKSLPKYGFEMGSPVGLCMIVEEDIKASLSVIDFSEDSVNVFTPYELNKLLKLGLTITEKDKFCDTVILFHSVKNHPATIFNTKETREFYLLNILYLYSPKFFLFFILILILINTVCLLNLSSNMRTADDLLIKLGQNRIIKEADEVYNFISIDKILSRIEYSPLTQIQYVEKLKTFNTDLRTFKWYYDETNSSIITKLEFHLDGGADEYYKLKERLNSNFRIQTFNISDLQPLEGKQGMAVYIRIEEKM